MVGGALPGEERFYEQVRDAAAARTNLTFHGRLSYQATNELYGRAKLLLSTSDVEGFPNSYLQAWIRGVPVVTLIDPDRVIERQGLGAAAGAPQQLAGIIGTLLHSRSDWQAASDRCRQYMAREFGEDRVLPVYLDTFGKLVRRTARDRLIRPGEAPHG
jgi:glycosyltransferase involved in cell wall biosynthesis